MNNIKYLTLLGFIIFSFSIKAQEGKIKKGEKAYEIYSYHETISKLEGVSDKTYEINKKLAESYFKTDNFEKAEEYYKEIATSDKGTSEDIFNYAYVLSINKKYKEHDVWMEKYANVEKSDSRAQNFIKHKGYYVNLLIDKEQFKIKNIALNTKHQDFGTAYYLDKIVFSSSRSNAKFFKRIWNWNELPFLDLFIADDDKTELTNVKSLTSKFNKKYHEGPASYTQDGNFTAFTRNNYEGKSKDEIVKLKIFTSKKEEKKWSEPKSVHFNSSEYSVGHPSLTPDGNTMYFASDMPGGFGGVDIYRVDRKSDDTWGEPVNLGKVINTEGNEMFPFIHESGILFFASNGLLGLGGLDVFYTKLSGGKYLNPKNVGTPVNSSFDDFAIIFDKKMKRGYFSSNRDDGKGDDDIYSFKLLKELTFDMILRGKTIDKNDNVLANTNVNLYDGDGNVIETVVSDENGEYSFTVNPDTQYKLTASKPKFVDGNETLQTDKTTREYEQNLVLDKLPDFTLLCTVLDKKTNQPISGVSIVCVDNNNADTKTYNTVTDGEFLVKLFSLKLNDKLNYTFTLNKDGYAPIKIDYSQLLYRAGEYKKDLFMSEISTGDNLAKLFNINPIYFDLDKSFIRSDARIELNKIVKIMNEYPNMVIELGSHTDCRQTTRYNEKLSDRRAKSSARYIKKRISKPSRIYGQGYGETQLTNNCPCEGKSGAGLECTEEQHQANRRTEFKIIKK